MKTLAAKYEAEDAQSQEASNTSATESKKKMMEEWVMYRVKCQAALESKSKLRETILKNLNALVLVPLMLKLFKNGLKMKLLKKLKKKSRNKVF